jgi:hypothetical protein
MMFIMKNKSLFAIISILLIAILAFACSKSTGNKNEISLAGEWGFQMDTADVGMQQEWFKQVFIEKVNLPGSMNTNGKGFDVDVNTPWTGSMWNRTWYENKEYEKYREKGNTKVVFWLQPDKYYTGVAWYQKEITIPQDWKEKQIILTLERCHWVTSAWLDDKPLGSENSLAVPHRYYLSDLTPGKHTLSIRIDNKIRDINPGLDAHSVSDNTQSNWNGIVGAITLEERPLSYISSLKIIPDIEKKQIVTEVQIQSSLEQGQATFCLQASNKSGSLDKMKFDINIQKGENTATFTYPMGNNPLLWDEFNPNLYVLQAELQSKAGNDKMEKSFGMREISTKETQITVNRNPVFIRGTLECCIFPLTGFPPTDVAGWEKVIKVCKSYGLNNIRFHSWCPPEAAFIAADHLGFYLQIECDAWAHSLGNGDPIDQFVMDESERIVREYGNHPSFCMLLYGNEPGGPNHVAWLTEFVKYWKAKDHRFLVSAAAGWPELPESDYLNLPKPRIQAWGEGINSIINKSVPGSDYDWSDRISKTQPTVSHEIGQWCVYPDLKERSKYKGAFKAKNFDIFEDRLKESELLNLADSFLIASGKLQTLCYKADIEAALRTKGFGGFQLLDLHDFPGQGTALVGVVDPFWDSKPYVTPEQYSQFCNKVVPLLRTKRFIYSDGETFDAKIEISNFSGQNLAGANVIWKLIESNGKEKATGKFTCDIPVGTLSEIGQISYPMTTGVPQQYRLEVAVNDYKNEWDLWVYPNSEVQPQDVKVTNKLDDGTASFLEKGGKVLLIPSFGSMLNVGKDSVVVGFSSIFWNTMWTKNQAPHTLGILCDPKHPALSLFPTGFYSNYQWQYAMSHCNAIPLHKLGDNIQPVVRIIDNWFTARSLGMIVELKVGKGKLMICSADLNTADKERPEAKQLKNSLLNYMQSEAFNPAQTTTIANVRSLYGQFYYHQCKVKM